jgi:hypothetical protein
MIAHLFFLYFLHGPFYIINNCNKTAFQPATCACCAINDMERQAEGVGLASVGNLYYTNSYKYMRYRSWAFLSSLGTRVTSISFIR